MHAHGHSIVTIYNAGGCISRHCGLCNGSCVAVQTATWLHTFCTKALLDASCLLHASATVCGACMPTAVCRCVTCGVSLQTCQSSMLGKHHWHFSTAFSHTRKHTTEYILLTTCCLPSSFALTDVGRTCESSSQLVVHCDFAGKTLL